MHVEAECGQRGVLELLIIQPTPFCNLDCDYCYLPDRQSKAKIAPETLRRIFQRAFESTLVEGEFTVVWHAGEPLVLPIAFYQEALAILAQENTRGLLVQHSFQTNATLLTPQWCEFLKQHHLNIGVSVDGPAFLHDRHRKTRSGGGTWERVVRGIRLLKEHEVPFHVISVLTAESLEYPDELFDFYEEYGVRQVCLNIEEIEGPHRSSSLSPGAAQQRYAEFLERFFDLVQGASHPYFVREFDSIAAVLLRTAKLNSRRGPQQTTPFGIISVDWQGNFSTFSPELLGWKNERYGNFAFGNVIRDSFESARDHPAFHIVESEIAAGVVRCATSCEYFPYCGGGAPVNKLFENGSFDSTETLFCRLSQQVPINLVLKKLSEERRAMGTCSFP